MEKEQLKSLFTLLNELHSREAIKRLSKEKAVAWHLALEPFSYEDVKEAAIRRARVNRYYPEPGELTVGLVAAAPDGIGIFSPAEIAVINAQMDEMLALGELMERDYIAAGLPHPAVAKGRGWSAAEWMRRCREGGV